MGKGSGDLGLRGYGGVEVRVVPSKTPGYVYLRLIAPGHSLSVHLSAQHVWEVIEQMHQGLADSMLDPAASHDSESALFKPVRKPSPSWANLNVIEQRVQDALAQKTLDMLVRDLYSEGWTEAEVYGLLDRLRADLKEQDREMDEGIVLEVLDRIIGFCSPHQQLHRTATEAE